MGVNGSSREAAQQCIGKQQRNSAEALKQNAWDKKSPKSTTGQNAIKEKAGNHELHGKRFPSFASY